MNRPARSIEIFTMSALDLFVTAMGSFAILMMILFPYFKADRQKQALAKKARQGNVLFCVWDTRFQDFEAFRKERPEKVEKPGDEPMNAWKTPGYEPGPLFPVTGITWQEAVEFCQWLTEKERAAKMIGPEDEYRLPTVEEWRIAAGRETYPWGDQWPPPAGSANLGGAEYSLGRGFGGAPEGMMGFKDDFEMVAPVGSSPPNRDGLFDLAGNVQQFCADEGRLDLLPEDLRAFVKADTQKKRTIVSSSWQTNGERYCRSDYCGLVNENSFSPSLGFRCVLVINSPAVK